MTRSDLYVDVWRNILCGWLNWPAAEFDRFVEGHRENLEDKGHPLFYHEGELYYVYRYLIPPSLEMRLSRGRGHKTHFNDLAHFVRECLYPAVCGEPPYPPFDENFDWDKAKARYRALLQSYGFDLPVHGSRTV